MKKILLTGGGTAGHVTPNIALLPYLKEAGFEIEYMGSYDGIEKRLIEAQGIPYYGISSGKLRRYLDLKNLTDPVRILKGLREAKKYMKEQKPDIVFSKGGFVSVPVIFAAAECHIPVVIHESDLTPGLANKLSIPKATKVCYNFPETEEYLPKGKSVHTGLPVRNELLAGDPHKGYEFCGFPEDKPLLMIIGGSLGAQKINETVRLALDELLKTFYIAHVCGKGKMDESFEGTPGYKQFEYVSEELPDLFAASNLIISRAGANVIYEIAALKKPSLLIPLGTDQSRGDQILNAKSFKRRGFAENLFEDELSRESLINDIIEVNTNRDSYIQAMTEAGSANAAQKVTEVILEVLNGK
ncbi:MAG: undecaprenyldiphospho-muramoylpentapeptide beta-N-acetylglucosaminyltransferase [Lachnospiraceae bacterium]|nr:undecaprenyldiphospho-muramoylpentapeptide beta-N-acetylglucosaminyltransferase [Lachnospiraceae bacterium]